MTVQTLENPARDSRIFVGVGIDCVRKEWQNNVAVRAPFLKTGSFPGNYLRGGVKTKTAPGSLAGDAEGLTNRGVSSNG